MTISHPLLPLPQGKFDQLLVARWALDRLNTLPENSPQRAALAQAWFDEAAIRRWLTDDEASLGRTLLANLPSECFAGCIDELERLWRESPSPLGVVQHLKQLAPEKAANWYLQAVEGDQQWIWVDDILEIIPALQESTARACLDVVVRLLDEVSDKNAHIGLNFIKAAYLLLPEKALSVAAHLIESAPGKIDTLEKLFTSLAKTFLGHTTWFELVSLRSSGESVQTFAALAHCFDENAPLAALDKCSALVDAKEILSLLESAPSDHPALRACRYLLDHCNLDDKDERGMLILDQLNMLATAALAQSYEKSAPTSLDVATALQLVAADIEPPLWRDEVFACLSKAPREIVSERLIQALKDSRNTWGEIHVAEVMGELAWEEFVPALVKTISDESGDGLLEAAEAALANIGEAASNGIIAVWNEFDDLQRFSAFAVLEKVGGRVATDFVHARFAELKKDKLEYFLPCLLAYPEPRTLALLEPELHRDQPEIDEAYVTLCLLLDLRPAGFSEIEARVLEEIREFEERMRRYDAGDLFRDSLNVEMICPACGEKNHYKIHQFFVGANTHVPPFPGEEFPCASCSAYSALETTENGRLTILTNMMLVFQQRGEAHQELPHDMFRFLEIPFEKEPLALNEIVAECRARLAADPADVRSLLQLGLAYVVAAHRNKATQTLRRVLELAPRCAEARQHLVFLLVGQKQVDDARSVIQVLPELVGSLEFFLAEHSPPKDTAAELMRAYNALRSPGSAALHANDIATPQKVGRNDPCPCGSGKKYKKCCGK